jgi:hypothetical protein
LKNVRPPRRAHARRGRWSAPLLLVMLVSLLAPPTFATSAQAGHGLLQVSTQPAVASAIFVDGQARNTGAVEGLELTAGEHEVCFSAVEGYLPPPCETVEIAEAQTSRVTGEFSRAGTVEVVTDPPGLEPMITIDDVERDRGAATVLVEVGGHVVCATEVAGYETPGCVDVEVAQGKVTSATLRFAPEAEEPAPDLGGEVEPPSGTNLLSAAQRDMVASKAGWSAQGNVLVASDASVAAVGSQSLKVTVDRSGPWPDDGRTARAGTPQWSAGTAVDAGKDYVGFLRVRAAGTPSKARCEVRFYSGQTILATEGGELTPTVQGEWTPLTCEGTAPAGTRTAALRVFVDDVSYGEVFHVDDPRLVAAGLSGPAPEEPAPAPTDPSPAPTEPTPAPAPEDPPAEAPASWQGAWDSRDYATIRAWYRSNTGIAAAGLTDKDLIPSGSISTSRHGQVIEGRLVSGQILVNHDNVTIRNTKVVGNGGSIGIDVPHASRFAVNRLNLENVSLVATGTSDSYKQAVNGTYIGMGTSNADGLRATRVYVSGYGNGYRLSHYGRDQLTYSMVENIRINPGSHNTGISFRGGDGKRLTRNWFEGSTSAGLALYPDAAPITDLTVQENLFDGGTYSVNAGGGDKHYAPQSNHLRYLDNLFTRAHQYGPVMLYNGSRPGNQWSGNAYLDGARIGS